MGRPISQDLDLLSDSPVSSSGWRAGSADVLTTVMNALRLRSRVFCRSELRAPWGMDLKPSEYARFHLVERGAAWLTIPSREPVALGAGDLVVVPHGGGHKLTDALDTPPRAFGDVVPLWSTERGPSLMRGGGDGPETHLVCGSFSFERPHAHPLVELLPPLVHLRPTYGGPTAEWLEATVRFLAWETREEKPGTETIVSRLTDVLFVQLLRAWTASLPEGQGGWIGALRDPQIGSALAHIHRSPEEPWTNAVLADAVGMSRSRFAARFTSLVGEPPLTYLSRWRLETAAGLLQDTSLSIGEIAARVGYDSEAAFSKAFRRRFQMPPGAYRRKVAA